MCACRQSSQSPIFGNAGQVPIFDLTGQAPIFDPTGQAPIADGAAQPVRLPAQVCLLSANVVITRNLPGRAAIREGRGEGGERGCGGTAAYTSGAYFDGGGPAVLF